MSVVSDFLINRQSHVNLDEPAPSEAVIQRIYHMAMRAPDHAQLKPCRFLLVEGEDRERLGAVFRDATLRAKPDASDEQLERAARLPLRAPMLVVIVARVVTHPKVPEVEQLMSAGCSAFALILGLEAEGYGAVWRTGELCYDRDVMDALGLSTDERLVGFVYAGTPSETLKSKTITMPDIHSRVTYWPKV